MSDQDLRERKMMVACTNANGERDLFVTTVMASDAEVAEGLHYEWAEEKAADDDYTGPYVAFDAHDQRNIAYQVRELDGPIEIELKDSASTNGARIPVYLTFSGGGLHIKARGFQECKTSVDGKMIAALDCYGGPLRLIADANINTDEPTHIVDMAGAANDRLGADDEDKLPMGCKAAMATLDEDPDCRLWEVEVGLFNLANDPNTPMETYTVLVASETAQQADDEALTVAEELIATVSGIAFSVTRQAIEADPDDYRTPD